MIEHVISSAKVILNVPIMTRYSHIHGSHEPCYIIRMLYIQMHCIDRGKSFHYIIQYSFSKNNIRDELLLHCSIWVPKFADINFQG